MGAGKDLTFSGVLRLCGFIYALGSEKRGNGVLRPDLGVDVSPTSISFSAVCLLVQIIFFLLGLLRERVYLLLTLMSD